MILRIVKSIFFLFILFFIMLNNSCNKEKDPISFEWDDFKCEFNKIELTQWNEIEFHLTSGDDFILPGEIIDKIIYNEVENDSIVHSEDVAFRYEAAGNNLLLKFGLSRRVLNEKENVEFNLTYYLKNSNIHIADSSFFMHRLTESDMELFLSLNTLSDTMNVDRIWSFDFRDGLLQFLYNYQLFEYDINNGSLRKIDSVKAYRIASSSHYTFFTSMDHPDHPTYRYNLLTSETDLEIDFSQLDFETGDHPVPFGMCISDDTLFMTIYHENTNAEFMLACFDLHGTFLCSYDMGHLGINGGLTKYGEIFFYQGDTGYLAWHRKKNLYEYFIAPSGDLGSSTSVKGDYFYYITYGERAIARVPIQEIINNLFSFN